MIGQNSRNLNHLPVGERVLVGQRSDFHGSRQYFRFPEYQICSVEEHDPSSGMSRLRKPDGTIIEVNQKTGNIPGSRDRLLWTDLLPSGSDEQVLAYCKAIGGAEDSKDFSNRGILLHVERIEDNVTYARPVFPAGALTSRDPEAWVEDPWTGTTVGNAAFWPDQVMAVTHSAREAESLEASAGTTPVVARLREEVPVEARVGDLIAAPYFKFTLDGERLRALVDHPVIVGNYPTRDDLGAFLPWGAKPMGWDDLHPSWTLYSRSNDTRAANDMDICFEVSRAHARTEPDEALVLWYKGPSDREREISFVVLGRSGIIFHEIDTADDYFYGWDEQPGLWLVENLKYWSHRDYEGEYDCGLEGDVRPATLADVERFGYTMDSLDAEIIAATDGECLAEDEAEQGVAERFMMKAVLTHGGTPEMAASAPAA